MIGVVDERHRPPGLPIPGVEVGGKTGTAQLGTDPPTSHAWIIGFAGPPRRPRGRRGRHRRGPARRRSEATGGRVAAPDRPGGASRPALAATAVTARRPGPPPVPCTRSARDRSMSAHGPPSSTAATSSSSRIGRGGMAEVYLARDQLLDRPGRGQGPVPRVRRRPVVRRALPARGPGGRQPQPPQHRRRLRLGRGGRHVLHRHGVRRRPHAWPRSSAAEGPLHPDRAADDRRRRRRRPRLRPPQRRRPPRREAGQRPDHRRRAR